MSNPEWLLTNEEINACYPGRKVMAEAQAKKLMWQIEQNYQDRHSNIYIYFVEWKTLKQR